MAINMTQEREEILRLDKQGMSGKKIAEKLGRCPSTITKFLANYKADAGMTYPKRNIGILTKKTPKTEKEYLTIDELIKKEDIPTKIKQTLKEFIKGIKKNQIFYERTVRVKCGIRTPKEKSYWERVIASDCFLKYIGVGTDNKILFALPETHKMLCKRCERDDVFDEYRYLYAERKGHK